MAIEGPKPPGVAPAPDTGHTLSVNHDDLDYFAKTILPYYLSDLEQDPGYTTMQGFSGAGGETSASHYTELKAGAFESGTNLQGLFKKLAGSVAGDYTSFHHQLETARIDVLNFLSQMDAAHEDALTAAEMMQILQDVVAAGGSGGGGGGPGK